MFKRLEKLLSRNPRVAKRNKAGNRAKLFRSLSTERLEKRELRAVDIRYDAVNDLLRMKSDGASDRVEVYQANSGVINVKVNGVDRYSQILKLNPVTQLHFSGNDGHDRFQNITSIRATAYGGNGNDTLIGGGGTDTLYGEAGADNLSGGGGTDYLYGGTEKDSLNGDDGVDYLYGGSGDDVLYGGAGNDQLFGHDGNDILQGGLGDDLLHGGNENKVGIPNNDTYLFVSLRDFNLGRDTIQDSVGVDTLDFTNSTRGATVDLAKSTTQTVHTELQLLISSGTVIENIKGSQLRDRLYGNSVGNTFEGSGGDDHLVGRDGDDKLYGGTGHDYLYGDNGIDYLYGGAGNDSLYGGAGNDQMFGHSGNDILKGDAGDDRLHGGIEISSVETNNDRYIFSGVNLGRDNITDTVGFDTFDFSYSALGITLDLGSNSVQTVNSNLRLEILPGTVIDQVYGSNHNDIIYGNNVFNVLYGLGGDDRLYGRGGTDVLYGGDGDDGMFGGIGLTDILDGGAGDDRYLRGPNDTDSFVGYVNSEDVTVLFVNSAAVTDLAFAGRDPAARWDAAAGAWTNAQIEEMDGYLATVQEATDNTRLLKRANDRDGANPFSYVMHGAVTQVEGPSDPWGIGGWNSDGNVHFVNNSVSKRTVFHEIGHNWDQETELGSGRFQNWKNLSGWTTLGEILLSDRSLSDYTPSLGVGDSWYMLDRAVFARDYSRVNPFEDMATTFEEYFDRRGTTAVRGDGVVIGNDTTDTVDLIANKIRFLDDLFAALA
jgi:Ca2+-binding RTX toxin-like protein